jgi:hypothetical protein
MAKAYFIPILKCIHSGTTTRKLVKEAITSSPSKYGSYVPAYEILESYLDSFTATEAPHVELIGIDCIELSECTRQSLPQNNSQRTCESRECVHFGWQAIWRDRSEGTQCIERNLGHNFPSARAPTLTTTRFCRMTRAVDM